MADEQEYCKQRVVDSFSSSTSIPTLQESDGTAARTDSMEGESDTDAGDGGGSIGGEESKYTYSDTHGTPYTQASETYYSQSPSPSHSISTFNSPEPHLFATEVKTNQIDSQIFSQMRTERTQVTMCA